jgi:hypothetical protein
LATSTFDTSSPCIRMPGEPSRSRLRAGETTSLSLAPYGSGHLGNFGPSPRASVAHHPLLFTAPARFFCTDTTPAREAQPPSFSASPPPGSCRRGWETAPFADPLPVLVSARPALRPPTPATVGEFAGLIAVRRRAVAPRAASQSSPPPAPLAGTVNEAHLKEHRRQAKAMPQRMDPPTPRHYRPTAPPSATHVPRAAMPDASGGRYRALTLLAVLEALAPVSRASFLALRTVTGLPDARLLSALLNLRNAGLIAIEVQNSGPSRVAFAISAEGKTALVTDEPAPAIVPPPGQRRSSAILAALAGRLLARSTRPDIQEGKTPVETDGQETPETAPDEPQKAPFAQGAPGRSPGSSHQSVARGRNDRLAEPTDPAVLLWASGVRSRNEACRTAHRAENQVSARLAALFDTAPPFTNRPDATRRETR